MCAGRPGDALCQLLCLYSKDSVSVLDSNMIQHNRGVLSCRLYVLCLKHW